MAAAMHVFCKSRAAVLSTLTRPNELPQISTKTPADENEHGSSALPSHMDVTLFSSPLLSPLAPLLGSILQAAPVIPLEQHMYGAKKFVVHD